MQDPIEGAATIYVCAPIGWRGILKGAGFRDHRFTTRYSQQFYRENPRPEHFAILDRLDLTPTTDNPKSQPTWGDQPT